MTTFSRWVLLLDVGSMVSAMALLSVSVSAPVFTSCSKKTYAPVIAIHTRGPSITVRAFSQDNQYLIVNLEKLTIRYWGQRWGQGHSLKVCGLN